MVNTGIQTRRLPEWISTADGKRKTLGGRWSMERIAEVLKESRNKVFSLDDLARLVYGTTNKTRRDNVRKHIPSQRNFMLSRLTPFITTYGPRGTIEAIKFFDPNEHADVQCLQAELQRMRDRKEITVLRYDQLSAILLPPQAS